MFENRSKERGFVPRAGFVVQAYRFALDPSPAQREALASHCGAARAAFNWAVARVRANWFQRSAEASYGIPDEGLTPWVEWSLPGLRRAFNQAKRADPRFARWWEENSKEAYSSGLANANAAFGNFVKSKRGERKGRRVGLPRFKRKGRTTQSCRFTTGTIRVEPDRRHVTLPRLGTIKTYESTRKLERRVADGRARVLSATVRFTRGRWFCSFQVEVQRSDRAAIRPDVAVGVDLGVKHLAVMADSVGGVRYQPNPKHLDASLKDLRRANRRLARRQGPIVVDPITGNKRKQQPSKRWESAVKSVRKVHARVANQRPDALHKLTTRITGEYGHVVVEDLHVAGMLRNRRLARAISGASLGEIRRQITYKIDWSHGTLHIADRLSTPTED
jgi:putative transposase